jgi:signal transduction histidine kinase
MEIRMKLITAIGLSLFLLSVSVASAATEEAKAVKIVNDAIEFFKTNGKEKTFAEIANKKGGFHQGELYVFVYDLNGNILAHGHEPELIGTNRLNVTDPSGKQYVKERMALIKEKGEGWQTYQYKNPVTGKVENKKTFVKKYDDLIFGSGVYSE